MPGISGQEVYKQIKLIKPGIKVLISSGYGLDERVKNTMLLGAVYFLQKPYTLESISYAMKDVLNPEK